MKHFFTILAVLLLLVTPAATPLITVAEEQGNTNVILLESLPGIGSAGEQAPNLGSYLDGIFKLALGIATGLAVLMIVIGGVEYMGSESIFKKDAGREKIQDALWGLLLALGAFLLLQTINPALVRFDIVNTLQRVTDQVGRQVPPPGAPGGGLPPTPLEAELRERLLGEGIGVVAPCNAGTRPCADLAGLPQQAIGGLIGAKNACDVVIGHGTDNNGCGAIIVTGGAETIGHLTHGPGIPFVDVDDNNGNFNSWVMFNADSSEDTSAGIIYKHGNNEYLKESMHWHICYGQPCQISGR
ncbi:hypothetical protein L0Y40_00075 [Candidatus Wolfebacteria bacterium]|nr:hypothetical protein [Candidatus Wolfebacteria bacterium]